MNAHALGRGAAPFLLLVGLAVAHLLGVALFLGEARALQLTHELAYWAGSLLGVAGTVYAARAFVPGDHLRRVWGLLAAGAALLLVGTALRT